jgi:hypothetical protein
VVKAQYRSAIDRLQGLPEFFTLSTFVRHEGMDRDAARVVLARWAARGWVLASGPRTGAYFNVLRSPGAANTHKIAALLHEYPSAILAGESVLHSAGWITQIPSEMTVIVEARRSYTRVNGFSIRGKPVSWYRAMTAQRAIHKDGDGKINSYGLRFLEPALVLADLYSSEDQWHPDPDDLQIPEKDYEHLNSPHG